MRLRHWMSGLRFISTIFRRNGRRLSQRGTRLQKAAGIVRSEAESLEGRALPSGTPLLLDINPGDSPSNPLNLTDVNGTLFFVANDGTHGAELWKSDGTTAGTTMVADIRPGSASSSVSNLTDVNGTLFFSANNGSTGTELWKSDGTTAGTTLVKNIRAGSASSNPSRLTNINGELFFTTGTFSTELWKSDGTGAGTVMFANLQSLGSHSARNFFNIGGMVFFTATDSAHGEELWKTDGTAAGTMLVSDIQPGSESGSPFGLTNLNGTLLFGANDGVHGWELWRSDGTTAGTTMVADLHSGDSFPDQLTVSNETLFFTANDGVHGYELWKSDGTLAGTVLVADVNPGPSDGEPDELIDVNGTLFFAAMDGTADPEAGSDVWKSDGTEAGTVRVARINSAGTEIFSRPLQGYSSDGAANLNGTLFFAANDGIHGNALWRSQGTAESTILISGSEEVDPIEAPFSTVAKVTAVGGLLFYTRNSSSVGELWVVHPDGADIEVSGLNNEISDGDVIPSIVDGTDFGFVPVGGAVRQSFVIKNNGDSDLNLTGNPKVTISRLDAEDFTITVEPDSTVAPGESTSFEITFQPSVSGSYTADVTIENNDGNENPFSFAIQGVGLAIKITEFDGTTTVSENGRTDSFDVVLTGRPDSDVVLALNNGDATEVSLSATSLTFTPDNWDVPQTVQIAALDDAVIDGTKSVAITVSVDEASSDAAFTAVAAQTVNISSQDNDVGLKVVVLPDRSNNVTIARSGSDLVVRRGSTNLMTPTPIVDVRTLRVEGGTLGDKVLLDASLLGFFTGEVIVNGNSGKDVLDARAIVGANAFGVRFRGGDGDDVLYGGDGNDTLEGDHGNDQLVGRLGDDALFGGEGDADLVMAAGADNFLLTNALLVGQGSDLLDSVELARLTTGNSASVIDASEFSGSTTLTGGRGADSITGGFGHDLIAGGDRNDTLAGGEGSDTLDGGNQHDLLRGGASNDLLLGQAGRDTMFGGDGNDTMDGGADNDVMLGDGGHDSLVGGAGHDALSGGAGNDSLNGQTGNDTILGGTEADQLYGGAGNDLLIGDEGRDTLSGQAGLDSLGGSSLGDGDKLVSGDSTGTFTFDFSQLLPPST